jgi:D-amino-acid dehydrogenase
MMDGAATKDAIVLGAGAVGVSVAAHLAARGWAVTLVDRQGPGEATSYGNSGLIQTEVVYPTSFPLQPALLLRYAANRSIPLHFHPSALPSLAPFLWRFAQFSRPAAHAAVAQRYAPIMAQALAETRLLADAAGSRHLLRPTGWMRLYRTSRGLDAGAADAALLQREFAAASHVLTADALQQLEPFLDTSLVGAVHYDGSDALTDPGTYVKSVARHVQSLGGTLTVGDAMTLRSHGAGWRVQTDAGPVEASQVVVALGPWSDTVIGPLGYRLKLAVKRGYHMHYGTRGNAVLGRPIIDAERGYLLAPMTRGIRLTTGIEFALRDALPTPVQLDRAEPVARTLFPLAERVDAEPWMGRRPCTPDMLPVISRAPLHDNLWFAFGHAHHGVTLSAVTGRVIAEMMNGEQPVVDLTPFGADRASLR